MGISGSATQPDPASLSWTGNRRIPCIGMVGEARSIDVGSAPSGPSTSIRKRTVPASIGFEGGTRRTEVPEPDDRAVQRSRPDASSEVAAAAASPRGGSLTSSLPSPLPQPAIQRIVPRISQCAPPPRSTRVDVDRSSGLRLRVESVRSYAFTPTECETGRGSSRPLNPLTPPRPSVRVRGMLAGVCGRAGPSGPEGIHAWRSFPGSRNGPSAFRSRQAAFSCRSGRPHCGSSINSMAPSSR